MIHSIKRRMVTLLSCLTMWASAYATDGTIVPVKVSGNYGESANLTINMSRGSYSPIALQFDLRLTDGLTRTTDEIPEITPASRIDGHATSIHWMPEIEAYRIVVYSLNNSEISGSSGTLMTLKINLDQIPATYVAETFNCIATTKELTEVGFNGGTANITVKSVPVTGISLSASNLSLLVEEEATLEATVSPVNATDKTVTWTSSNETVAKVTDGKVKALKSGSAVITAKCGSYQAKCNVTVSPRLAEEVVLNTNSLQLIVSETAYLEATVLPENTTDKTITWTTSNASIATVDANGKVNAVAVGTTTITATAVGGAKAECVVTVKPVTSEGVVLNKTSLTLKIGEEETLVATVLPENTTDKTVVWSSSNTAVATVDANGNVKAVAVGTATITAKNGTKTANCEVTVKPVLAETVTLNKTTLTLLLGQSADLTATISPTNTTDKTIAWTTSNASIATVDANGKVNAVAVGTTTVTATAVGGAKAECVVTVKPVTSEGVVLNKTSLTLKIGEEETLVATVLPENTTDKTVVWSSSNTAVATVDANGKVTAFSEGQATITATNGTSTASCEVTVEPIVIIGDSNGDGKIDITDVEYTVNYAIGIETQGFVFESADTNYDGVINVTDVVNTVNIVLSHPYNAENSIESTTVSVSNTLYIEDFNISPDESKEINVMLENPDFTVSAFQFNLKLPEGLSIAEEEGKFMIGLTSRASKSHIVVSALNDGVYTILAYSSQSADFTGNDETVLNITFLTSPTFDGGELQINGVVTSGETGVEHLLKDSSCQVSSGCSVNSIDSDKDTNTDYYNLNGMKVKEAQQHPGIHIKRVGNNTYKVMVK